MTALEVLCAQAPVSKREAAMLDAALAAVSSFTDSPGSTPKAPEEEQDADRRSILNRVRQLKTESIGRACRRMIGEKLGDTHAARYEVYARARAKIVHDGNDPDNISELANEIYGIVWQLLTLKLQPKS